MISSLHSPHLFPFEGPANAPARDPISLVSRSQTLTSLQRVLCQSTDKQESKDHASYHAEQTGKCRQAVEQHKAQTDNPTTHPQVIYPSGSESHPIGSALIGHGAGSPAFLLNRDPHLQFSGAQILNIQ